MFIRVEPSAEMHAPSVVFAILTIRQGRLSENRHAWKWWKEHVYERGDNGRKGDTAGLDAVLP